MSKSEPVVLSWLRIEELAVELAKNVRAGGFTPDALVGIAVGGLVPLALLARELVVKEVVCITARSYSTSDNTRGEVVISHLPEADLRGKRVLLVDEISDSGETLRAISDVLKSRYGVGELKSATLVMNSAHCLAPPDFSVLSVDAWVTFPWEEKIA